MDARGRSGRNAREEKKTSRPVQNPVRPAARPGRPVPGPVDRSPTGRDLSYRVKTGKLRSFRLPARLTGPQTGPPGCRPVDRTPDRPIRSLVRLTGFQTGPVRVCLDQIYSGSVIFVLFRPEVVLDAYISHQDAPLAALDHV